MIKKLRTLGIILIVICCLIGCIAKGPESTVNNFMNAFKKNDINALLDTIDPEIVRGVKGVLSLAGDITNVDVEDFLDVASFIKKSTDEDLEFEYEIISSEIDDATAIVKVSINNDESIVTFSLIKIDGEWYINGYDD